MEKDRHTEEDEEKERNTERRHHDVCRIQQKILIFPAEAKKFFIFSSTAEERKIRIDFGQKLSSFSWFCSLQIFLNFYMPTMKSTSKWVV